MRSRHPWRLSTRPHRRSHLAGVSADVHDSAASTIDHAATDAMTARDRPLQVDGDDAVPGRLVAVEERTDGSIAALLTRTSTGPSSVCVCCAARSTALVSETST